MSRHNYTLTPAQQEKEKAIFWAIVLDTAVLMLLAFAGLFSGSMTALSEIIRFALLLFIEYISYVVLRRAHRDAFKEFEYGTGKIERITNIFVAFGLLMSSIYIIFRILSMDDGESISANSLMLTMIGANINVLVNYYFAAAFIRSNQTESSVIISSQIASRIVKTVASGVVFGVLVLTLWLPDPRSARIVDMIGSFFLVVYMIITAIGLIKESLPEILDRTIPEPEHYQILRILAQNIDQYDGFGECKARRSGKDLFIILKLCFLPSRTMEQIETRLLPIRKALHSELPGSIITIESTAM